MRLNYTLEFHQIWKAEQELKANGFEQLTCPVCKGGCFRDGKKLEDFDSALQAVETGFCQQCEGRGWLWADKACKEALKIVAV